MARSPIAMPLPVDEILPELLQTLARDGAAVLQAPPGSGKTTRVPLRLAEAPWLGDQRVIVLEPRRVAARAAARRMAFLLGENTGDRVGYRVRHENTTSATTVVEVVTEGVLVRMLQGDAALGGVGAVVFDEFHERSIHADLGLALTLDVRSALRPDLRVLVMSATLETAAVAGLLGGVRVLSASTAPHPVTTIWLGRPHGRVEPAVAGAVLRGLREHGGDVLAFLPGASEIRVVERMLREDGAELLAAQRVAIVPLHGALASASQDDALRPTPDGTRKVVLATAIAETSITIDGVRTVIDSGLMRVPRFDPSAGMTRLVTIPVSKSAAEQRRGRAARQGPGFCYRLWSETDHASLPRQTAPEILVADLAPLALDLAEWGVSDAAELRWIDPPPAAALGAARQTLTELDALDAAGRITGQGRALARLGVHPRLGHLLLRARDADEGSPGVAALACQIAAVLSEGDPLRGNHREADLTIRVIDLRRGQNPRAAEAARRWQRLLGVVDDPTTRPDRDGERGARRATHPLVVAEDVGRLLALAYPDRVGRQRRGRPGGWLLRNGRGAWVPDTDPLASAVWVVAADLDGDRGDARIWLGAPLDPGDVEALFTTHMTTTERTGWNNEQGDVVASRERRLGAIVVSASTAARPTGVGAEAALYEGIRSQGLGLLPWTPEVMRLRARAGFARRVDGPRWADVSDTALLDDLESWLAPWMRGRGRRADLASLPLGDALWGRIGWQLRPELDVLAPSHVTVPSGSRHALEYPSDGAPILSVRVQELFGTSATPAVGGGRVPVVLHLMSPAGRPVQVTSDLASFWATTYHQVRGELRARYPRHPWPDDPATATPTNRARARPRRA